MKKFGILVAMLLTAALLFTGCAQESFDASSSIATVSREDGSGTRGAFVELMGLEDEEGNDVTLTGHDINTSDYRVAYVTITSGTTAQDSFTEFEEEFTYLKEYDPAKEYKFAIVCASSKDGDLFKGAGGSTLIVDEFEVICE